MLEILDLSLQEQLELRIEREISNQMDAIIEKVNRIAKNSQLPTKIKNLRSKMFWPLLLIPVLPLKLSKTTFAIR
jgi:hypothetical protein